MPTKPHQDPAVWTCSVHIKNGVRLAGNREGLRQLRQKIEQALEAGVAECDPKTSDWTEIRVVEVWPWRKRVEKGGIRYCVTLVAVGAVVGTMMLIFGLGIGAIISWWR